MTEPSTVQVIPFIYDLIVWSSTKLAAFPRKHRFTLDDRLMTCQLSILELLITAQFEPVRRAAALRDANLALEQLRYLFRLAKDLQCLTVKELEHAARQLLEAGRMVGGWRKHARGAAGAE